MFTALDGNTVWPLSDVPPLFEHESPWRLLRSVLVFQVPSKPNLEHSELPSVRLGNSSDINFQ